MYNTALAFTSCGAKIDYELANQKCGIFTYKLMGEMYHMVGSLIPEAGKNPNFCQMYIYDAQQQIDRRQEVRKSTFILQILAYCCVYLILFVIIMHLH